MRFHWLLLLNILSVFLFTPTARAGKLLFWDFKSDRNQLTFVTDEGVQPAAQLITNPGPNRVVIDLPGTNLGRSTINKSIGKAFNRVRIGQFDEKTTRIVIELAPGYTIDPTKVKFKGISATRWIVNLPNPQRVNSSISNFGQEEKTREVKKTQIGEENNNNYSPPDPKSPQRFPSNLRTRELARPYYNTRTSLPPLANQRKNPSSAFKVRGKGLFVEIDGNNSENKIRVKRSSEGDRIDFYLEGILLPAHFQPDLTPVNRHQIEAIQFTQESNSPPIARISLKVDPDSPDWRASFSRLGGLIIAPQARQARIPSTSSRKSERTFGDRLKESPYRRSLRAAPHVSVSLVNSLELVNNNSRQPQLLIKADREIEAKINKNRRLNVYEIIIPNAKLAKTLKVRLGDRELGLNNSFAERQLPKNSPISNLSIRERDDSSVEIILKPALGVRIGEFDRINNQWLALSMRQLVLSSAPLSRPLIDRGFNSPYLPLKPNRSKYYNRRSNQKVMVMLDPGHGGKDPGAIGIGRLREKDIVLPISLMVRQFLEQEGVKVKMTRQSDYFVSLAGRTKMANQQGADIFVSIHANAINLRRQDVNGLETYYYNSGRRLAQTIHNRILRSVPINDRKVRKARFYVLRKSVMPAVLVEVGFVTGREDAPKLRSPRYRREMARAIAAGILDYIRQN